MKKKIFWTIVVIIYALIVALLVVSIATLSYRSTKANKYNLGCVTIPYEKPLTDCRE